MRSQVINEQVLLVKHTCSLYKKKGSVKFTGQRQVHSAPSPIAMMVNLPKHSFQNQNKPSGFASLECNYCHGKNHTKDKCFKLVGYPSDHPYHPNKKGKKRPFTNKNAATSHNVGSHSSSPVTHPSKADHAMQITAASSASESHGTTSKSSNWTAQMAALQQQMNTLMHHLSAKGSSSPTASPSFSYGHNVACTTFSLSSISTLSPHVWILDTGATNHMCCDVTAVHDVKAFPESISANFPNGEASIVTHS
ncbi:uncharacterized protein LOC141724320 [Apium graveolens]|uniref:uncharacterized protein LOC141724320 n=1 Tax=Apium graveolens TaxID=4045 RepID=UPI003D7B9F33